MHKSEIVPVYIAKRPNRIGNNNKSGSTGLGRFGSHVLLPANRKFRDHHSSRSRRRSPYQLGRHHSSGYERFASGRHWVSLFETKKNKKFPQKKFTGQMPTFKGRKAEKIRQSRRGWSATFATSCTLPKTFCGSTKRLCMAKTRSSLA